MTRLEQMALRAEAALLAASPGWQPTTEREFELIRLMTEREMRAIGMRVWDDEDRLMLFPGRWFDRIPHGFRCQTITGADVAWGVDAKDDETRGGVLAFGIRAER